MAAAIPFRRALEFSYGVADTLSPLIRRVIAETPSPFTFHGTGTYIIGRGEVAVIDAGPDLPSHVAALLGALEGETVSHLLVTHTHRDHSPATRQLKAATGATTYGFGPHGGGRAHGRRRPAHGRVMSAGCVHTAAKTSGVQRVGASRGDEYGSMKLDDRWVEIAGAARGQRCIEIRFRRWPGNDRRRDRRPGARSVRPREIAA